MKAVFAIAFLALIGAAVATPVTINPCDPSASYGIHINSVDATPYPLSKDGGDLTVTASATLDADFTGGSVDFMVLLFGAKIFSKTVDACSALANTTYPCPLKAGPYSITTTASLPKIPFSGTYQINVSVSDSSKTELACFGAGIQVSTSLEEEASIPLQRKDIIDFVNKQNGPWTATSYKQFEGKTAVDGKKLMGTRLDRRSNLPAYERTLSDESLPASFDWRKQGNCVHPVLNQEQCGSCWAFGATEAFSDRICVASKGSVDVVLSPEQLVTCDKTNMGCNGGYLQAAWSYMEDGVVSYDCFPYDGKADASSTCSDIKSKKCPGSGKFSSYSVKKGSVVNPTSVSAIKEEIYKNGPVEAAFEVYQDFMNYQSGIYVHKSGSLLGGHAIKLVGWGSQDGTDYWIAQNSWGTSWGLEGYFWIKMGECSINDQVFAGIPQL